MTLQKVNTRNTVLILMIVAAGAFRLVSYKYPYVLSNFTPVGAIALFGGAYFTDKWKAYLVPLLTLFLSDIALNYLYTSKLVLFYSGSFWVYLCFAIMVFIGFAIKKINVVNVLGASLLAPTVFFLLSNFITWSGLAGGLRGLDRPLTFEGLLLAYGDGLPFYKGGLLSTVIFSTLLFGGYYLITKNNTAAKHAQA